MRTLGLLALILFASLNAHASALAISDVDIPLIATATGGDQLFGWYFTANSDLFVTHLGVFDADGDGLSIAHDVGIYNAADHALMVAANVPAGTIAPLLNGFRYAPVAPFFLAAGNYAIVMTMPESNLDGQMITGAGVSTAPDITWTGAAFSASSSLAYPNLDGTSFNYGMFGPNFLFSQGDPVNFQVIPSDSVVPEPATPLLTAAGALLFILRQRRARRLTASR